ncbi:hypothetical protein ACFQVA_10705 [Actinomadura keratinilytica]
MRGPFNLAADPVIDSQVLAGLLESRSVELPPALPRAALSAGWRLRALGASPGLFDAVLRLPLLDTARVREELGWSPEHSATEALDAFLRGVRSHGGCRRRRSRGTSPPPPEPDATPPGRLPARGRRPGGGSAQWWRRASMSWPLVIRDRPSIPTRLACS